ncbi:MAG: hypothetical protein QMC74_12985 [Myxococcota bacterium]|jgi:hypothetical protein
MSEPHRNKYEVVFSEPGALTAALSWYRAVAPGAVSKERRESIEQPVLSDHFSSSGTIDRIGVVEHRL